MGLPVLKIDPKEAKEQYIKYKGKKVIFKGKVVEVGTVERSNQKGSYERGLAWSRTTYGVLIRARTKNTYTVSADHGATWHKVNNWEKDHVVRWTKVGRVKLDSHLDKEFAFEGIQAINRQWEGPNYRWKP